MLAALPRCTAKGELLRGTQRFPVRELVLTVASGIWNLEFGILPCGPRPRGSLCNTDFQDAAILRRFFDFSLRLKKAYHRAHRERLAGHTENEKPGSQFFLRVPCEFFSATSVLKAFGCGCAALFHRRANQHLTKSAPPIYFYQSASLGGRLTVGLQTLDLRIGVRIPASQPTFSGT